MSKELLSRKRAPMGGSVAVVLFDDQWVAGQIHLCPGPSMPQMLGAVKRIACVGPARLRARDRHVRDAVVVERVVAEVRAQLVVDRTRTHARDPRRGAWMQRQVVDARVPEVIGGEHRATAQGQCRGGGGRK